MRFSLGSKFTQLSSLVLLAGALLFPATAQSITAEDFRNSRFRGFHLEGVHHGRRSPSDIEALARTGANIARISVYLKRCAECTAYDLPASDLGALDALVHELARYSIYSLVVLRPMGDERGPFWLSSKLQASFTDHWKSLAARYKGLPSMAGFDLLNEPVPPGKTYDERQSIWLSYANALGSEIRTIDPERVLIVESAPDATAASFANMKPLVLGNVVYSFHSYSPFLLTHQGVAKEAVRPMTYGNSPSMDVSRDDLYKILGTVTKFALTNKVPILVGEFSMVRYAPQGSAARYIDDSIEYFESSGWSWIYHDFRGWTGWDAEVDSQLASVTARRIDAPVIKSLRARMARNSKP